MDFDPGDMDGALLVFVYLGMIALTIYCIWSAFSTDVAMHQLLWMIWPILHIGGTIMYLASDRR